MMLACLPQIESPQPAPAATTGQMAFINHLRFMKMACRTKPQADLFQACALLHVERSKSKEAHSDALVRCLPEAFGSSVRLHAPRESELTFDEQWLLRLASAIATHDEASVVFLLRSRVAPEHRRLIRFLVSRISDCFSLV